MQPLQSMAKKVIDIVIDGNTGKISIHVDGYDTEACDELAEKLAGSNILIPTVGDSDLPHRRKRNRGKTEENVTEKEEIQHE
jgi:hypothetical protein